MKTKIALIAIAASSICLAQAPPSYPPAELDRLVQRIALYPDPLLAQALSAATFADEIPDAAHWSDQHHYLTGEALAHAITEDQLPWDPSVQALLPFPTVLESMAADMPWTTQLGNAVLAERPEVMDAVQRMRALAMNYGYLQTGPRIIVGRGPFITIMPVNPAFLYVPFYDPGIVFVGARSGYAITFGFGFNFVGVAFQPWGWGVIRLDWASRGWFIHNALWSRTWANRATYVHNYPGLQQRYDHPGVGAGAVATHPEGHKLEGRSVREKAAEQKGGKRVEEHRER